MYPSPTPALLMMRVPFSSLYVMTPSKESDTVHVTFCVASALPLTYTVALSDVRALSAISRTILLLSRRIPVTSSLPISFSPSTTSVASPLIFGSFAEYAVTLKVPALRALMFALLLFPVSSTSVSSTVQRICVSSVAGIGVALSVTVLSFSVTSLFGQMEIDFRASTSCFGAPTTIFADADTEPIEASTVTVPAVRGENANSSEPVSYSIAPSGSVTVQRTDLPGIYSPASSYTPAVIVNFLSISSWLTVMRMSESLIDAGVLTTASRDLTVTRQLSLMRTSFPSIAFTVMSATPSETAVILPLDTSAICVSDDSQTNLVSLIRFAGCPETLSCSVAPGWSLTLVSESMMYLSFSPACVLSMTSTRQEADAEVLSTAFAMMNAEPVFSCGITATILPDCETLTTSGSVLSHSTAADTSSSAPLHTVAVMDWRALSARSYERYFLSRVTAVIWASTFSAFSTTVTLTVNVTLLSVTVTVEVPASTPVTVIFFAPAESSADTHESELVMENPSFVYVAG